MMTTTERLIFDRARALGLDYFTGRGDEYIRVALTPLPVPKRRYALAEDAQEQDPTA